jgi:NADH:ubiquinone oxidoreductase subunit K
MVQYSRFAKVVANLGMISGMFVAMIIGWVIGEYPLPVIEWGITQPNFGAMTDFLIFNTGLPDISVFLLAFPTAMIAYVIAFGDILVGQALSERVDEIRPDEKIETNITRIHIVTGIRNGVLAFFAPWPGLAGPIWTAAHATLAERYALGRKAMDSIYSGGGTFWWTGLAAIFILPLVTLFRPVLPIALSLTLLLTAYICIMVGIEQLKTSAERGVAGIVAVTLAMPAAQSTVYAIAIGIVLYILIERPSARQRKEMQANSLSDSKIDSVDKDY